MRDYWYLEYCRAVKRREEEARRHSREVKSDILAGIIVAVVAVVVFAAVQIAEGIW